MKPPRPEIARNWDRWIPTRRTLLSRLKDLRDEESWREFFGTYWKLLYHTALNAGLSDAEAKDVVQETVLDVAERMPSFRYDPAAGSFKHWLLTIARRRIADIMRQRSKAICFSDLDPHNPLAPEMVEQIPDPAGSVFEALRDQEWETNQRAIVTGRMKGRVDPKHYQVFDLLVFKKWKPKRVSRALRVSLPRVYLIKFRLAKVMKQEAQRLEHEQNRNCMCLHSGIS